MAITRRNLFGIGPAFLAVAAVPHRLLGAEPEEASRPLASLFRADFEPLTGSSFAVKSGAATQDWLTLLSVEDLSGKTFAVNQALMAVPRSPARTPVPRMDCFALHFSGAGPRLPQDTYELEHATLGRIALFLVPAGASGYTALFNRLAG